jgi:hypothetical protein
MDIRTPGAAPFHLRATFHAYPGEELLSPGQKPKIMTGDGVYDEVWMEPHRWRREVTFGSYHAVEVFANGVRKFQATDDYEPSRVHTLLEELIDPLSRRLFSEEYRPKHDDRILSKIAIGGIDLVRISYMDTNVGGVAFKGASYYFQLSGVYFMRSGGGMSLQIAKYAVFEGKLVPGSLELNAGTRKLLTASVLIEKAPAVTDADFDLPVERADAGMALNPRCDRGPQGDLPGISWTTQGGGPPANGLFFLWMVDRRGYVREPELIAGAFLDNARELIGMYRKAKFQKPAEIDGSPCETASGSLQQ